MAIRRTLTLAGLALAGSLLTALPAPAYLIILKDGTRIEASAKPVAQGRNYLFRDKLGARKMIAISEVDPEKTDAANKDNFRDAYVLGEPEPIKKETESAPKAPSLSEYIKQNRKADISAPPQATPGIASAVAAPREIEKPAGPAPGGVLDPTVQGAFLRAYETASVRGARVSQGGPGTIRVQAVTDGEAIVFGALVGTARGLKESRAAGRAVERVELYMSTSAGENAGTFTISADDADALLNGRIAPAKFFVANVQL